MQNNRIIYNIWNHQNRARNPPESIQKNTPTPLEKKQGRGRDENVRRRRRTPLPHNKHEPRSCPLSLFCNARNDNFGISKWQQQLQVVCSKSRLEWEAIERDLCW
ncbi:hypothetical protein NPIL_621701 [Nephila pilipes]|uniref:Uncharacterized protein n=1 Tax=Nephila pilipes TaxID=299642 RepID=A0A8X6R093_NEPPI|nr:hypothetical protein NPIL_621701 [Nephila pilipes]